MNEQALRRLTPLFPLAVLLLLTLPSRDAPARQTRTGTRTPPVPSAKADGAAQARLSVAYGQLPLSFEANQGQADAQVQFLSKGKGYSLFLTPTEAVLALRHGTVDSEPEHVQARRGKIARVPGHSILRSALPTADSAVLRMKLVGANPQPQLEGLEELPGKANYFLGNDPKKWRTNVPTYGRVKVHDVYPGIDLIYYGRQQQLEYDLVVAFGADPNSIRMSFEGADKLEIDTQGNLVLHTASGELVQHAPNIYQEVNGTRETVAGRYVLLPAESPGLSTEPPRGTPQQVAFQVDRYDPNRALVIDPVLVYSTYLGGSGGDGGSSIAVDSAGNAYVTGITDSPDFPTSKLSHRHFGVGMGAFILKFNATGSELLYSAFLGGGGGSAIAVDTAGNAYVTGGTSSPNFPTKNPLQPSLGGGIGDAFATKLNAAGTALVYSTFLGGSGHDGGSGIAVDAAGNTYVTGRTDSPNFPTQNPLQPTFGGGFSDAFVAKLNPAGSALVYSTFLGGSNDAGFEERGEGIAVDPAGNAYVMGRTDSADFPTQNPLQPTFGGGFSDAFVAKLNPAGSALVYSTYLGGSEGEFGHGIAVDPAGNAYVTGETFSGDFPTSKISHQQFGRGRDAFVLKLNATGSELLYSVFLGGSNSSAGRSIAVDSAGNTYLTGLTHAPDFPTVNALQPAKGGDNCDFGPPCPDAFVAKLNAAGSALVYSTYLGGNSLDYGFGIAVDSAGNAYVRGWTESPDFPTQNPLQPAYGGNLDAFVAKIASGPLPLDVAIDIKPGSSPNSLNPRSNGNIPVAILTTESFDASSVDPSTVSFGRTGEETAPLRSSLEDVEGDGDLDLVLHFDTQQTGILCGDSLARLSGKNFDGQRLEGSDSVRTVGCD
jgi:hypothetical protein